MCLQLDELCTRLCDCRSYLDKFGQSLRPSHVTRVSLTSSLAGSIDQHQDGSNNSNFLLTPKSAAAEEGQHLKMEWIRLRAPMVALRTAIEVLLDAFWSGGAYGLPEGPAGYVCRRLPLDGNFGHWHPLRRDRQVSANGYARPLPLVFLEASGKPSKPGLDHEAEKKWKHIPDGLQEHVQEWFELFCFELSELGYSVQQQSWAVPPTSLSGVLPSIFDPIHEHRYTVEFAY